MGNNVEINGKRKLRYLASIVTTSIRGGDLSDAEEDDNDDERYSRQMYALGARAHKLVRSTTAILDGPLGGKRKLDSIESSIEAVRVDGADGFDGLDADPDTNVKGDFASCERSETPSGLLYEI